MSEVWWKHVWMRNEAASRMVLTFTQPSLPIDLLSVGSGTGAPAFNIAVVPAVDFVLL